MTISITLTLASRQELIAFGAFCQSLGAAAPTALAPAVSVIPLGTSPLEELEGMLDQQQGVALDATPPAAAPAKAPAKRGRPKKAAEAAENVAGISTGEERTDPANADDEGTAAQDAADEAAEADDNRDPDAPLTLDDVKSAISGYVTIYGMPATQEDGPKIFVEALGQPPAGEKHWKLSILPDDQDKLQKIVATWKRAIAENPLKRPAV